jgi:hypothetical protein
MKKVPFQVRQGDVFIEQIDPPTSPGQEVPREGKAIVLAYGETSGHRHQLTGEGAKLFQRGSARMLEVSAKGGAILAVTNDRGEKLTPERHLPVKLPPGSHSVRIQLEWTIDREVRRVID